MRSRCPAIDFVDDGDALVERLARDWSIDVVVLDFALAMPELVDRFDRNGPRLIGFGDPANAGFALGAWDSEFIDTDADTSTLIDVIEGPLREATSMADLSDRSVARQNALSAEAERVAAALARLAQSGASATARPTTAANVRAVLAARRARDRYFPSTLFGDPAWDMLLDLFAAHLEGGQVSVSSLCIAAAVPTATALRWIRSMCTAGLFDRQADPFDGRRAFIRLPETTQASLVAYFAAVATV